jgi:hypothetical protein
MNNILTNLLKSFNGGVDGYSSKKLTAFVIVLMVVITHIKWIKSGDFSQLEMVLTIDYAFIASLFGMTTYQSLKTQSKTSSSTVEEQVSDDIKKTIVTKEEVGGEITKCDGPVDAGKP